MQDRKGLIYILYTQRDTLCVAQLHLHGYKNINTNYSSFQSYTTYGNGEEKHAYICAVIVS